MFSIDQYSPYAPTYDGIVKDDGGVLAQSILNPCIFSLLGHIQGRSIADACCGQGYLARALARHGARVVGVDISASMLAVAKQRTMDQGLAADYVQADVTQPLPLARQFHAAICTLALMDIYDYQAAIQNISAVLFDGAQFIVSLVHPVHFHNTDYFDTEMPRLHAGLARQGINVHYWQRPLEDYANALAAASFCIRQIKEPRPSQAAMRHYPDELAGRDRQPSFIVLQAIKHGAEFNQSQLAG